MHKSAELITPAMQGTQGEQQLLHTTLFSVPCPTHLLQAFRKVRN